MTDISIIQRNIWVGTAFLCGVMLGAFLMELGSHKPSHSRRPLIEHCIIVDTAPDYRDVQCPSGEWRYIGDTLHIRLHT